jgi:hypothetical protein
MISFVKNSPFNITTEAHFFLEPASTAHRQYEALRAYFVEGASTQEAAQRFGYSPGALRVMCHHLRRNKPDFFREVKTGRVSSRGKGPWRELIGGHAQAESVPL